MMRDPSPVPPRNPGPNWGYRFLTATDQVLPRWLFNFLLGLGTWVSVAAMPGQRAHSRTYLRRILGRPPSGREVWRHFFTFALALMRKLRSADGQAYHCTMDPGAEAFGALMRGGRPALLGTFHLGDADLLGFMLGQFRSHVYMIRLQMENSPEMQSLAREFGDCVRFIWVNETENLLFALKDAIQSGGSVAMQCDRPDYSAKLEPFEFLGERRLFPFTIYHLALIVRLPVIFCLGIPVGTDGGSVVHSSPVFEPDNGSKRANLARAHAHFQAFLGQVETQLQRDPFLWFNFTPLNPVAPPPPAPVAAALL
jgi:predicted LPLAT superfamily acyltransferase